LNQAEVLQSLQRRGSQRNIDGMARYAIVAKKVYGVSMSTLRGMQKEIGKDHALALQLWDSGWYEARLLAALIDDPRLVTKTQMNAWAGGFENWADCDTACFHLFDRTPHAFEKARQWAASPREFVKRGAFALMASLALHDKAAPDKDFLPFLPLIEKGARDERNFVKKGVSWALRGIGRRNRVLHAASMMVAKRLAESREASARWVGKDALRELSGAVVKAQLAKRAARTKG
jgi:3-methyladenine DNA glycosylase AlkD